MKINWILAIFGIGVIIGIVSIAGNAHANVLYVGPWEEYTSIQDAIDNATDGDIIIVKDGIYYENIKVDKRLILRSEKGPDNCIIDGRGKTVVTLNADGITIEGFTIRNATKREWTRSAGIRVLSNSNNIGYNKILKNEVGIKLKSSNNIIAHNNISSVQDGISLLSSFNNSIAHNNISGNWYGIKLESSSNNIITHNKIPSGSISLESSSGNIVTNNTMYSGGVTIYGNKLRHWNTHTIENNTVNGKPIYYFKNKIGEKIPEDAGEVILANCSKITVENLKINNTEIGIEIAFSSKNVIRNNSISHSWRGIDMYSSIDNVITWNNISNNCDGIYLKLSNSNTITFNNIYSSSREGIELCSSNSNFIAYNNILKGEDGVFLLSSNNIELTCNHISWSEAGILISSSNNSRIISNHISNNAIGILIDCSFHNSIKKNNFVDNGRQAFFLLSLRNHWWHNYWDDWKFALPRPVFGIKYIALPQIEIAISWFDFDWLPATKPYSIG
ncbi:MAG: hypothetical protein DRN19_00515 [Thermoplasmata archaeon]|nr:MAG: hypothetical protein DRN19_00515 [Thermoplasmata archaeon]